MSETRKRTGHTRRAPNGDERCRIRKAIAEESRPDVVAANKALGQRLQSDRDRRRKHTTAEMAAVLAELCRLRIENQISLAELADRTGMTRGNLSRVLNNPEPNVTIDTVERIAAALGHRIKIALVRQ